MSHETLQTSYSVAVAVAVLKYRLYDIDRVISRALAYGSPGWSSRRSTPCCP